MKPLARRDVGGALDRGVGISDAEGKVIVEQRRAEVVGGTADIGVDETIAVEELRAGHRGSGRLDPRFDREVVLDHARDGREGGSVE